MSYLKYTEDEEECKKDPELMAIKIVVKLNEVSPFEKKIRLLDLSKGERITLKGFSGYDLKAFVGPKGILRRLIPKNNSEEYIRVLRLYFGVIRDIFKKEWNQPKNYIIATNRGITAFLKLLRQLLITTEGKLTYENVKKYMSALKGFNWSISDLKGKYIGSAGWRRFYNDLSEKIRETYPEFGKAPN